MRDLFDIIALDLPINGVTYRIPPISAEHGLLLTLAADGDKDAQAKLNESTAAQVYLGPVEQQMRDDLLAAGVPLDKANGYIARATLTAIADHRWGREKATETWEAGELPELRAALIAAAELAAQESSTTSTTSTSSASAKKTRSPASTGPTTSRKATPSTKRPAKRSAGPR